MPKSFDTTFVPQQPLLKVEGFQHRSEPVNLAMMLAFIVLFVVLIVAGGVSYYHNKIVAQNVALAQQLEDKEKLLDANEINAYRDIDLTITSAKKMLHSHNVFSVALNVLESETAQNVELVSLSFAYENLSPILKIEGNAPSYEAVYFQSEVWRSAQPLIQSVVIEGVDILDQSGVIKFTASIVLSKNSVLYSEYFKNNGHYPLGHRVDETVVVNEEVESISVMPGIIPPLP